MTRMRSCNVMTDNTRYLPSYANKALFFFFLWFLTDLSAEDQLVSRRLLFVLNGSVTDCIIYTTNLYKSRCAHCFVFIDLHERCVTSVRNNPCMMCDRRTGLPRTVLYKFRRHWCQGSIYTHENSSYLITTCPIKSCKKMSKHKTISVIKITLINPLQENKHIRLYMWPRNVH